MFLTFTIKIYVNKIFSNSQETSKYGFEYRVKDEYGNDYAHKESRVGSSIKGVYTVLLPDGRKQIVHYEANEHGFNPSISYEEPPPFSSRSSFRKVNGLTSHGPY